MPAPQLHNSRAREGVVIVRCQQIHMHASSRSWVLDSATYLPSTLDGAPAMRGGNINGSGAGGGAVRCGVCLRA